MTLVAPRSGQPRWQVSVPRDQTPRTGPFDEALPPTWVGAETVLAVEPYGRSQAGAALTSRDGRTGAVRWRRTVQVATPFDVLGAVVDGDVLLLEDPGGIACG